MNYHYRRSRHQIKQDITGYTIMIQQYLDQGYQGYLMTTMFNQLSGNEQQKNHQMQVSIEGMYASLLTRMVRKP